MSQHVLRVFDSLASAQSARAALVAGGFGPVGLEVLTDEAGPAQGNFVSGNGAVTTGGNTAFKPEPPHDAYAQNFQPVRERATCLLCVEVSDDTARRLAESALAPFGGIDAGRHAP